MIKLYTLLHLLQLYILSWFLFLFLMYVPFVLATVNPDKDGQRGPDEEDRKIHQGNAGSSAISPFSQFCLTNLRGFCLNITHIALKASIFRKYP